MLILMCNLMTHKASTLKISCQTYCREKKVNVMLGLQAFGAGGLNWSRAANCKSGSWPKHLCIQWKCRNIVLLWSLFFSFYFSTFRYTSHTHTELIRSSFIYFFYFPTWWICIVLSGTVKKLCHVLFPWRFCSEPRQKNKKKQKLKTSLTKHEKYLVKPNKS